MISVFLIAIFLCLVGVAVMVVYLVDRVRKIELNTAAQAVATGSAAAITTDERFGGLAGEVLWRAVTAADDAEPARVQAATELRLLFLPVLQRHIEELFEEGVLDGRQGVRVPPPPARAIKTASGQVLSWLPAEDSREIYEIGLERSSMPQLQHAQLVERLDRVAEKLFHAAGLTLPPAFSAYLLPNQSAANDPVSAPVQIGAASESMPLEIVPAELDKMPIVQEFKN
jgi:hypothetical protein